jgi:hypothetical protein
MHGARTAGLCLVVTAFCASTAFAKKAPRALPAGFSVPSIQIAPELKDEVAMMLRRSPTFRSQFRRIAAARRVVVAVNLDPMLQTASLRALTTFRRYTSGLVVVSVSIGPVVHPAQWIGHEFEHVLEQLEGRQLSAMSDDGSQGVWQTLDDTFETERAMRAGETVREEVHAQPAQ